MLAHCRRAGTIGASRQRCRGDPAGQGCGSPTSLGVEDDWGAVLELAVQVRHAAVRLAVVRHACSQRRRRRDPGPVSRRRACDTAAGQPAAGFIFVGSPSEYLYLRGMPQPCGAQGSRRVPFGWHAGVHAGGAGRPRPQLRLPLRAAPPQAEVRARTAMPVPAPLKNPMVPSHRMIESPVGRKKRQWGQLEQPADVGPDVRHRPAARCSGCHLQPAVCSCSLEWRLQHCD